jgi:hypothetical protein
MDLAIILSTKYVGEEWILDGDSYEGLTWLSDSTKPTQKELEGLWKEVQSELKAKEQTRIDAKASAITKLKSLGLTIEEVEVAFGLIE